jgi:hypothetical protein
LCLASFILFLLFFILLPFTLFMKSFNEIWTNLLLIMFSLSHPLPVARYLLKRDKFIALSSQLIRDILYSQKKHLNDTGRDILAWYNNLQLKIIKGLLKKDSISLEMILKPPDKESEDITAYCPRCQTQYRHQREDCADCRIALNKY